MARLVALLILILCAPSTALAKWSRVNSANFVLVGDAAERDIRAVGQRLEEFRDVFARVFSQQFTTSPVPMVVIVFKDQKSMADFRPMFRGNAVEVAGFFAGTEESRYIVVDAEQEEQAYGVIFHEYAHFLLNNAVNNLPVWLSEGYAEFYQTFTTRNGGKRAMVGLPNSDDLRELRATLTLMPVSQLISVTRDSPLYNEGSRRGVLYAESWALVHYLMFDPSREGQLNRYLTLMKQGAEARAAFDRVFGDPRALDKELFDYIRRNLMPSLFVDFDEKLTVTRAAAQPMTDAQAAGHLGDLLMALDRRDDARAYLRKTLDRDNKAALAMAALGRIELREGNGDTALQLLAQAAALAPDEGPVQRSYARALNDRAMATRDDADVDKARLALGRALTLEPANSLLAVSLASLEMRADAGGARAVELMQQVVKAAPGYEEYRLMLAQAMVSARDLTGASTILGPLVGGAINPQVKSAARDLLGWIGNTLSRAGRDAGAAAEAPPLVAVAAPSDELTSRRRDAPQGVSQPWLRAPGAGETRVLGVFSSVTCVPDIITLQIDTDTGPLRMSVASFDQIEFITYRDDSPGSVACGPQTPAFRVLATFRTDMPVAGAGTPNRAVAIELVPDGFVAK